jgi:transposase
MRKQIGINERGLRVGEDHQNAKLTDAEVDMIRELHREGLSYKALAVKFEVSKSLVRYIVQFKRRGQVASSWRTVHVQDIDC